MKNFGIIGWIVFISIKIGCYACSSDEEAVNAMIDAHLVFMKEHHGMNCTGRGMGSPHGKIENIGVWLDKPSLHTIDEARRLAVSGLNDLINKLNNISNGSKVLSRFPCSAKDVYYSISFVNESGQDFTFEELGDNISCVNISKGVIYYITYKNTYAPPTTVHLESYEDSLKVIESLAHPENLLPE